MSKDYEVGYGRPPKHTQFKKGRSGNPKGRPKGTKNFATDLAEELNERVIIREGGKTKRVSKQRAAIKALIAKSLRGDVRALAQLVSCLAREFKEHSEILADEPLSPEQARTLDRFEEIWADAIPAQAASPDASSGYEPTSTESASPAPETPGRPRRRLEEKRRDE